MPEREAAIRRATLSLLVLLSICASGAAQSADKVLDRYRKAVGGDSARTVESTVMRGTVRTSSGETGRFVYRATSPDRLRIDIETASYKASEGYNGKSAWRLDRAGLRTLPGPEGKRVRLIAIIANDRLMASKEITSTLYQSAANQEAGGAVALGVGEGDARVRLLFDPKSNLLVKLESESPESPEQILYDDLRPVDGVKEPFRLTIKRGSETIDATIEAVEHNAKIDLAIFDHPVVSGPKPLPDIAAMQKSLIENQEKVENLRDHYTYRLTETNYNLGPRGVVKSTDIKVYEVTPVAGASVRKLVILNGKELSPAEREKEERRVQKKVEDTLKQQEKSKQRGESAAEQAEERDDLAISRILRVNEISGLRRESFRGRTALVFDYRPPANSKSTDKADTMVKNLAGTVWIDEGAQQVIRLEASFINSFKFGGGMLGSVSPLSSYVFEQELVNNELWLPSMAEARIAGRVLFSKLNRRVVTRYSDFKKYKIESQYDSAKPAEPKKP